MNLIWVNGIGILFVLILLLISMYPSKSRTRPTLSRASRFHRVRARSFSQIQSSTAQNYVWNVLKRKSIRFQFLPFLIGFVLTFFFSHYMNNRLLDLENDFNEEISTMNLNTENLTSISEFNSRSDKPLIREPRIWFVMSTTYSLTQAPSIIRIAQALFPVRHFVTLVLVKHYSIQNGIEHLSDLDRFLRRFSVPYVLLSTRQYQKYLNASKLKLRMKEGPAVGLLTGIAWVLQDTKRDGVLMMADEEYTFSSAIFDQVRYTKKFSSWPVAFGHHRSMSLGLTSPIVSKDGRFEGYFDGNSASWDTMPLEVGAFGINIPYFRNNGSLEKAWMLATDFSYTLRDLGFDLEDVQPLGNNCSKILVWRTKCNPHKWPSSIQYKEHYKETNMDTLMRSVFGVRFRDYVREETHLTDLENL